MYFESASSSHEGANGPVVSPVGGFDNNARRLCIGSLNCNAVPPRVGSSGESIFITIGFLDEGSDQNQEENEGAAAVPGSGSCSVGKCSSPSSLWVKGDKSAGSQVKS